MQRDEDEDGPQGGLLSGREPAPGPELDAELTLDLTGAPLPIKELALAPARFVYTRLRLQLDGSSSTLPLLDHYIAESRGDLEARPQVAPLLAHGIGAYFGEVLRRENGGFWRMPGVDPHAWELCSNRVFLAVNPFAAAWEVLYRGAAHAGPDRVLRLAPEDEDLVAARLAALPEVDEDEYFQLGTRFDVIQIAIAALEGAAIAAGHGDVRFAPEDYQP